MALLALATQSALAQQEAVLNSAGYSGLSVTPTARLMRWGTTALAYDNQVPGAPANSRYGTSGHNFVAGFGLLPNLEVSGRIAASTLNTHCYTEPCGVRDLSFNFKAGLPLDRAGRWYAAVGATDLGGAATYFRSAYGVLTYSPDRQLDLSLGYARRENDRFNRASAPPIDGPFASALYRPLPWLQGHVEYVDGSAWAGARVFAPSEWLPAGWSAHVGANVRLTGDGHTARNWWSVGLTVPLYKVPTQRPSGPAPMSEALPGAMVGPAPRKAPTTEFSTAGLPASAPLQPIAAPLADPTPVAPPNTTAESAATPAEHTDRISDTQLRALAKALGAKGFEDIAVGRLPDGAVAIQVNNATYNVNSVDGLGVALGVIARQLADVRVGYRLVLTQRQIAIVGARGRTDCLAQWVAMETPACTAARLYTPGTTALDATLDEAAWVVQGAAPSWTTTRLMLQPVVRSTLATEYGVFDYSVGVRATVQQPLWKGGYAEVSHVAPVAESSDFRDGEVFGGSRIVNATDRVLLHQFARIPVERLFGQADRETAARWGLNAVTAHVAAGRFDSNYRGAFGELRWEPGDGRNRFSVEGGRFERTTDYDRFLPIHSRSLLANYRYAYTPTHTYFEATAGQFLYNDRGVRLGIKQWFHDVAVTLYVRRTKFDWERQARSFAGIELSIPLTPRKDMNPTHHIQVTGSPRWSYGVETVIQESSNYITTNQGVSSTASALDRTFNSDRAGLVYFEDNMRRVRSAARQ
ncbi:YjbH domain-containing protein [Variovorax sp. J22R115]|uniref:YjbH domain-containing protein n=1 Tax=Variovorax sp. J22R115 TaxID=3053509 RepID=UPI002578CCA6|nr:YjbH domain-containing protein [Variovorax sp. J22R115]MDM0053456.1 YjbH domain-containing protein [Variovorax sp. J22R115]